MSRKKRVSKKPDNIKIKEPDKPLHYPVLCFKHLTKDKKFNIKYFRDDKEKLKAYGSFFYLVGSIQETDWLTLYQKSKASGLETIPSNQINFKPYNYKLTPDEKVIVFRFYHGKYRLIGVKSAKNKDVLHVLGFDFDHSAYDHGK